MTSTNDNELPQWVIDVLEDHKAGHTIEDLFEILGRGGYTRKEIEQIIKDNSDYEIPLE